MMHVKYRGEFSWEIAFVIPYCNWLVSRGVEIKTSAAEGTESLYFFSKEHSAEGSRSQLEEEQERLAKVYRIPSFGDLYREDVDNSKLLPPDYKSHYKNDRFVYDKPLYIINNKYTEEWGQHPSKHGNYLSLDTLKLLFEKLQDDYQVVYIRPQHSERGFSPDGHGLPPFKDHDLIRDQYPKVLTIQDLLENNKDLDFNTIQLMVHSNSEKFISVVGGNGLFSSYFGGTNIIYGKTTRLGPAIQGWWKDLSGCKISYVKDWKSLLREVDHREIKLSIRKMDMRDIPLFNEIRNECRQWLHNPQEFSIEQSKEWFKNKKDKFFILVYDRQDIGYFRTSNYDPSNNSIFVGLDIHRLYRGRGISTRAYLQFFKKIQKELGIRNMFLRVLKKNKRAFSLYEKLGFKVLDKTDDDFFMYLNMQEVQWGAK